MDEGNDEVLRSLDELVVALSELTGQSQSGLTKDSTIITKCKKKTRRRHMKKGKVERSSDTKVCISDVFINDNGSENPNKKKNEQSENTNVHKSSICIKENKSHDACESEFKKKDLKTANAKVNKSNVCIDNNKSGDNLIEMPLKFTIQAVTSQKFGNLIRKRSNKCHFINSNYTDSNNIPFVYTSNKILHVDKTISNEWVKTDYKTSFPNGTVVQNCKYEPKNDVGTNLQSAPAQAKSKRKKRMRVINKVANKFEEYLSDADVEQGLLNGELIEGIIRINMKNPKHAYVTNDVKESQDYFINSIVDRNRALEGDVVILKPKSESTQDRISAKVVYISEMVNPRKAVGFLSVLFDKGNKIAAFLPRDTRLPRIKIAKISLPPMFFKKSTDYNDILYMAKITEWNEPKFAMGAIIEKIGDSNKLETETKATLLEHQLDVEPFPSSIYKHLPTKKKFKQELKYREDLRNECVFTIDPMTARDLDDAVSCKVLENGNLEVGVHIADVTHFLKQSTDLDEIVSKKGTTIYLVDNVYHMLPVELCLHCSLLPGTDSLAFSVFWEMTQEGEILKCRFARTIINSCCQLAYEHAQKIIDDDDNYEEDFPDIFNGFKAEDLHVVVKKLQKISVNLRQKRFKNGALKLDQLKLSFKLNAEGEPVEFFVYENKESHQLIEELMLLANISVAEKIKDHFPEIAFLRCHEKPKTRMLVEVQQMLEIVGLHINIDSSAELHESLQRYSTDDVLGKARNMVLNHLLTKPMTRARYYCASHPSVDSYQHYALSIPIYTHFTSPIRRYADIMVHRLLAASLGYCDKPAWDVDFVQHVAMNCNNQKYKAKKAGEASCDIFLTHYIEKNQPYIQDAVVSEVREKVFDIIVLNTGSVIRMFTNDFEDNVKLHAEKFGDDTNKIWKISVVYPEEDGKPETTQVIEIFQIIKVQLSRKGKTQSLQARIVRPES